MARRRRSIDELMRRVIGLESAGQILGGEEMEVLADRENLGFGVKMIDGGGGVGAGDETQTFVLDEL